MREPLRYCILAFWVVAPALGTGLLAADEIQLRNGGRIRGEWLNHDEQPRRSYVLRTEQGGRLTLGVEQVLVAVRRSPAESEYARIAATFADTVDEQWKLATWCHAQRLEKERVFHLQRVVALDPDHVAAWHALGCMQLGGEWTTRRKAMERKGYVSFRGRWHLRQEVALIRQRERLASEEGAWRGKLRLWRSQWFTEQRREAQENLAAIRDPLAIRALAEFLECEPLRPLKLLYVAALGEIQDPRAPEILLETALRQGDEEVLHACVDALLPRKTPGLIKACSESLRHESNPRVNRAAVVLGRLADPTATEPLIDALITTHHRVVPGSTSTTVGTQREVLSLASSGRTGTHEIMGVRGPRAARAVPYQVSNQEVLDALVEVSGGVSFGFDQRAWRRWLAVQRRQQRTQFQARRD